MLERSRSIPKAKPEDARLIIPVIVHDGDLIPEPVKRLQPAQLQRFRIAYIYKDSIDYQDFSKAVKELAPQVAEAIKQAPNYEDKWIDHCQKRFNAVFEASNKGQTLDPQQFQPKRPTPPTSPPRINL
jgi:hypothetical protein